ncbi:MAG: DUF1851 domain-containing protein [Myxococcales bacterium]|nr:DUF1851 domain-containing protein [Myxococcales bacterium]
MVVAEFESFHEAFPPDGDREPYDATRFASFADKVPVALVSEWRQVGFGSFGSGILWMPPPDEPVLSDGDWPGLDSSCIEVLRTAFGNVCIWQQDQFHWLSVYGGKLHSFPGDVELFFYGLGDKDFRHTVLRERIFNIARDRLGDLSKDECYGFAPLPTLGGAIAEKYLIKTRMREYLSMVAQTVG